MRRAENAVGAHAVKGPEPPAPELESPRLTRGAGPVGGRNRKKGVVEGFRVLTLLYRVSELARAVAPQPCTLSEEAIISFGAERERG